MANDIQKLLKKKPTGDEVGRMMLEDLVLSYRYTLTPDNPALPPLLTDEQKTTLVNALKTPEDILRYNEYRYVHEYLLNAQMFILLQSRSADVKFWQLYPQLELLRAAEEERTAFLRDSPHDIRPTYLQQFYRADAFLARYAAPTAEDLAQYREYLRMWFAVQTAIDLLGDLVGVPDLAILAPALNMQCLDMYNAIAAEIPPLIRRDDPAQQDTLRAQISALLTPIQLADLTPTPPAIKLARAQLTFGSVQGGMQSLYALLKRKEDPDEEAAP